MFEIMDAEYEERRHIFALHQWISDTLWRFEQEKEFETQYFERIGRNVKKLLEEAIPICRLGMAITRPGDVIYVTCKTGNQPYDAIFEIDKWGSNITKEIKVEVTTTETDDSVMRRQALSRIGTISSGPVWREGRDIHNEIVMVDVSDEIDTILDLAFKRLVKKVGHGYGSETVLLVYIGGPLTWEIPLMDRAELVRKTHEYLYKARPELHGVYYLYERDFSLDKVKLPSQP